LSAQRVELALERAVGPAKLTELAAEALTLLLPGFQRAPQAIALIDQGWGPVAELILTFREPAGGPLCVVDRLDLTHLRWCLLVGSDGLRVRSGRLDWGLVRKCDELVRGSGHERRAAPTPLARRGAVHQPHIHRPPRAPRQP